MSLILWFFVMFIFFVFSKIFNLRIGKKIPRIFHKGVLKILNIKISLFGKLEINKPGLIISNHASWLDIIILSSLTDTSFIEKNLKCDYLPYDQRHFKNKSCSFFRIPS